jgi:hypothetical protein
MSVPGAPGFTAFSVPHNNGKDGKENQLVPKGLVVIVIVIVIEFVKSDACGPGSNYPFVPRKTRLRHKRTGRASGSSGNKKSWEKVGHPA